MADRITYVGLDVHKESIVVAAASGGLRGEVRGTAGSRIRRRRWTACCARLGGGRTMWHRQVGRLVGAGLVR